MSPPFDTEREINENFEDRELSDGSFDDQEQSAPDIEPVEDTEDSDESEPAGSDIALGSAMLDKAARLGIGQRLRYA